MAEEIISNNEENTGAVGDTETVIFTDEQKAEISKLLQSESDKRVTQALAKQKKEYEKKLSLSQLDDEARAKEEMKQKLADYENQIQQFNVLAQKNEVMKTLSGRGLPSEIADCLNIGEDATENQAVIDVFDKAFKNAVKAEVEKRLNSTTPKKGIPDTETLTKEKAKKMSLAELNNLAETNPELYAKFFN